MNTEYDLVIESFIEYLDEMEIVEEGFTNPEKVIFDRIMNTIKNTEDVIQKEKALSKRVSMYQSLLKKVDMMTTQLKSVSSGLLNIPKMIKRYRKTLPEEQDFLQQIKSQEDRIRKIIFEYNRVGPDIITITQYNDMKNTRKEQTKRIEKAVCNIKETSLPTNKRTLANLIQKETILFLRKYVSSADFKSRYKPYLHMIDIRPTDYGEICSITFTNYQSGYDDDIKDPIVRENNNWYYEVMEAGEAFISRRFGISADTGDGDEGTLYIN